MRKYQLTVILKGDYNRVASFSKLSLLWDAVYDLIDRKALQPNCHAMSIWDLERGCALSLFTHRN
jgi:hypothetical protein